MDAFLSSHLLDGTLGRCLVFIAVANLAGIYLWRHHFNVDIDNVRKMLLAGIVAGISGAALNLNSTIFQMGDAFVEKTSRYEESAIEWESIPALLLETSYGLCWISFCILLLLTLASVRYKRWMLVNIAGLMACLSLNGHAADDGLISFAFVLDMLHVACVLCWVGGLLGIVFARFTSFWKMEKGKLAAFSRFILPVFVLAQLSGMMRLAAEYFKNGGLNMAYLSVAVTKILLVIAVCFCALRLRKKLRQTLFDQQGYDDVVVTEFFLAILLLMAAAMLTQLPQI